MTKVSTILGPISSPIESIIKAHLSCLFLKIKNPKNGTATCPEGNKSCLRISGDCSNYTQKKQNPNLNRRDRIGVSDSIVSNSSRVDFV